MARLPVALLLLTVGGLGGAFIMNHALQGQAPIPLVFPRELTSYGEVVKRVLPAVVSVEAFSNANSKAKQSTQRRRPNTGSMPGIPEELRNFLEGFDDGQQFEENEVMPRHSFGSGFIIDPKGVVLTNYHVVAGAARVQIQLKDGRTISSTDFKTDRKNDLAIVHIKSSTPLPHLELGDSDAMEIGDRVLAVGAPFGLTGSVTAGIVSAKGRTGLNREGSVYEDYVQTDAAINPGNSGGPLVNLEGRVIGINTAIKTESGGWQGVGLAITSNLAKSIVDQLIHNGVVHRGYLGVTMRPLDPEIAARMGLKNGVEVIEVKKGTPAAKAGIKAGDIIVSLAGKPVTSSRELQHIVGSLPIQKPTEVTLIRDDKTEEIQVTVEEQPDRYGLVSRQQEARQPSQADLDEVNAKKTGVALTDLSPELANRYGFDGNAQGALITKVQPGSAAAEAKLQPGMVIAQIDKHPVKSAVAAATMLQKADLEKGVLLQVKSANESGIASQYILLKAVATVDK
ncbi:MAG TPA: trypsin-like peptidase domain-containing protein [Gemmataceae bacterium]|nr:trypsin-like peptidase domain-containing protein [Gemmataceae bacterium]